MLFIRYLSTCLLEELLLANSETRLRNCSIGFKSFFVAMSVEYAVLGIIWIRPLRSLCDLKPQKLTNYNRRRLLYIRILTGYFIIAIFSVGFLVAGSELERLQALFPMVSGTRLQSEHMWLTWSRYLFCRRPSSSFWPLVFTHLRTSAVLGPNLTITQPGPLVRLQGTPQVKDFKNRLRHGRWIPAVTVAMRRS